MLANVKYKIRSLRKSEKSHKRRWLVKKAKNDFKSNPYNAGKTLLDPKCYVNLKVKQEDLDQHKSSSLIDINYDIPLADLEGLPDKVGCITTRKIYFLARLPKISKKTHCGWVLLSTSYILFYKKN